MLMAIIFLLLIVLLGGFIVVRLKRQNQQATPNRRRRHRDPHFTSRDTKEVDDSDDVLGLHREPVLEVKPVRQPSTKPVEVVSITLMAPQETPYTGYELLQSLLASGLRYGAMNIFHRHENKTGRGRMLFSVASVNQPGTFELPKMGSFSCPGLTLFIVLKDVPDPMKAFDTMLETARQLLEDLGGEAWDDQRQLLNMDKVSQMRARIKQFEENQRVPDFFSELQAE